MLFLAVSEWDKKDNAMALRRLYEVLGRLPGDIRLKCSLVEGLRAWCIYESDVEGAEEGIESLFREEIPEMETHVKAVSRLEPSSPESYTQLIFKSPTA